MDIKRKIKTDWIMVLGFLGFSAYMADTNHHGLAVAGFVLAGVSALFSSE